MTTLYYTNKLDIFEVEEDRPLTTRERISPRHPWKEKKWIAYKVIQELGKKKCRLSQVHVPVLDHENVHASLQDAQKWLIDKLEVEKTRLLSL